MQAKVTASAASSLGPSLTAANARDLFPAAASSTLRPCASIVAEAGLAFGRPGSSAQVVELFAELMRYPSVAIFAQSMRQAAMVRQGTAICHLCELVTSGDAGRMVTNPEDRRTGCEIADRTG